MGFVSARSDPSYFEPLWCPECGRDSEDCKDPDEHEREWIRQKPDIYDMADWMYDYKEDR